MGMTFRLHPWAYDSKEWVPGMEDHDHLRTVARQVVEVRKKNLVSEKDTGRPGPKGPKDPIIKYLGLG